MRNLSLSYDGTRACSRARSPRRGVPNSRGYVGLSHPAGRSNLCATPAMADARCSASIFPYSPKLRIEFPRRIGRVRSITIIMTRRRRPKKHICFVTTLFLEHTTSVLSTCSIWAIGDHFSSERRPKTCLTALHISEPWHHRSSLFRPPTPSLPPSSRAAAVCAPFPHCPLTPAAPI